jgi:head-tail adaptor
MAGSGYWRSRYRLEAPSTSIDAAGQGSIRWVTAVEAISGVVTPSQREVLNDLGVTVRTDVVLEMAFHPSVKASSRLVDLSTGEVLNISGVVDPDGNKRRRLRVTAVNMGGQSA